MNLLLKSCIECGKTITGRADKKFCGDICRNTYNNRQYAIAGQVIRKVNITLKKNRQLLEEVILAKNEDIANVSALRLSARSFNFDYFTHTQETPKGKLYFCYEYGYQKLSDGNLMIVREPDPF
ncbi:MAG: hypothetical protein H7321_02420 [Bacteroidia bacterium]|nr:hypothetical protein [Bacteroidia bacterium]